jgi:hypothetical protein
MEFDANHTDWSSFGITTVYQLESTQLPGQGEKQNIPVTLD